MALKRLDDDEKGIDSIDTLGGQQDMTVINESGLYSSILGGTKEICNGLGHGNPSKAAADHVDEDDLAKCEVIGDWGITLPVKMAGSVQLAACANSRARQLQHCYKGSADYFRQFMWIKGLSRGSEMG